MKETFEGAINGVKYTDPEAFKKAMDELVNSNKSFSSICSKKVVEDDSQLDLFNDSVISPDNIFPSIDQAIEKLANGKVDYNLLTEINKDLKERESYLKDNIDNLYIPDVMKRLNISKDKLNNKKRLLKSEIDRLLKEIDHLEGELVELDRVRDEHLDKLDNTNNNLEKLDLGKDIMDSFEDYYENCLDMLYDHNSKGGCEAKPIKDETKRTGDTNIDLNNLMKFFEDLWR